MRSPLGSQMPNMWSDISQFFLVISPLFFSAASEFSLTCVTSCVPGAQDSLTRCVCICFYSVVLFDMLAYRMYVNWERSLFRALSIPLAFLLSLAYSWEQFYSNVRKPCRSAWTLRWYGRKYEEQNRENIVFSTLNTLSTLACIVAVCTYKLLITVRF